MIDIAQQEQTAFNKILANPNIDEYIFIFLVAASFIGELILDTSLIFGFFYWLFITPLFFLATILSEKVKTFKTGRETTHLIRYEMFYWGSASIAVVLVFFLWDANRIAPSEASTVIHIILAHTLFLSGIVLGLRFYLLGILLFATAALNIMTDFSLNFGVDILIIVLIIWAGLKVKNQFVLPILKRESDFTKSKDGYPGKERRMS